MNNCETIVGGGQLVSIFLCQVIKKEGITFFICLVNLSSLHGKTCTLLYLQESPLSLKCKLMAESCPEELALLFWAMHRCSGYLVSFPIPARYAIITFVLCSIDVNVLLLCGIKTGQNWHNHTF